jgi:hypothetical protein
MWEKPIVEIRVEEYERGTLPRLTALYQDTGLPVLERHIGRPLAFYFTIAGRINSLIQIWGYDSMAHFQYGRTAVEDDADWNDFRKGSLGLVRYRENRLTQRMNFPIVDNTPHETEKKPVVDFRSYFIHYDKMKTFLDTTEEFALPVQLRQIGAPLGYFLTTVGNLQQVTHLWGYDSLDDMEKRREARNADPEWKKYLDSSNGIYERQETQIMRRLKLFPED